jgi:hypothetical protein
MKQQLDIEFDDLSGQQNYGTVQDNNALGKTLGGLKLAAGAANAVQEFDIRVWIETWCEPVLTRSCGSNSLRVRPDRARHLRRARQAVREARHQRDHDELLENERHGAGQCRARRRRPAAAAAEIPVATQIFGPILADGSRTSRAARSRSTAKR